jgi:outer membrane protein
MTTRPIVRQWAAFALALWLSASQKAAVAGSVSWLDDPFSTRALAGTSPAKAAAHPDKPDPCLQQPQAEALWSLLDVVNRALCHNPQTRQTWASARFQAAQVGVNRAAYLPAVNVTTSASRNHNNASSSLQTPLQTIGAGVVSRQADQSRVTTVLSLNYLLLDFGGREARLENARRALEAADWTHSATLQSVLLAAVQAYYQSFAARSALEAAVAAEHSSEEALEAAAFRHRIGAAALADELQAQTAYAQAKLNRRRSEGDVNIASGSLANVLGFDPDRSLSVAAPALEKPQGEQARDIRALIDEAKASRPDLAAAEAQVRAAEAGIRVSRSGALPTLSLVSNYAYTLSSAQRHIESWSVGLQVSVPLFTGFANTYQIRGAEEQLAVQEANRERLDQSVALDVWRAYHDLNTASETFRSSEDLLASATQAEEVALGRYKAGAGSILDLLSAQANLANARFQHIQAQYNWHIGKARLAQALGRLDPSQLQ